MVIDEGDAQKGAVPGASMFHVSSTEIIR
jgi:hypothetical protein